MSISYIREDISSAIAASIGSFSLIGDVIIRRMAHEEPPLYARYPRRTRIKRT